MEQVSFIESENAEDMIAVHADSSAATVTFGTATEHSQLGVDLFFQSDGGEGYAFIGREAWDTTCAHLVETNLHPEWSYARQMAFGSSDITAHKPRGLIVKQDKLHRRHRVLSLRTKVARFFKRSIYTALELTDGSTVWERRS